MDKITLKELAPYLPYGLKILSPKHRIEYGKRTPLVLNGLAYQKSLGEWQYEFVAPDDDLIFGMVNDPTFTPLFHPLSNLTKPITVEGYNDGKPFVPSRRLRISSLTAKAIAAFGVECGALTYADAQQLFSWHFDLHNLIGRGLALPLEGGGNG